jgi:hypothetical protein
MAASAGNARAQGAGIGSVTATGKWTQPGVPHKGWTCVDIEDLGSPDHVCEMCEVQDVRYVHIMEHANYVKTLRVGCICAGHMEGDSAGARDREAAFRALCARRARWLAREWSRSRAGNPYLNTDGFNVVVFRVGGGWSARLSLRGEDEESHKLPTFATEEQAKLASFDAIIVAKAARARRTAEIDEIRRRLVVPRTETAIGRNSTKEKATS